MTQIIRSDSPDDQLQEAPGIPVVAHQVLDGLLPPSGWLPEHKPEDYQSAIGDFMMRSYRPPDQANARFCCWLRSESEGKLSGEAVQQFQRYLAEEPEKELKGEKAERDLLEVLGNGVLDNEGDFETLSLRVHVIPGEPERRVLLLEARWPDAEPPKQSIGVFLPGQNSESLDQVWFIADIEPDNLYAKYRDEALKAME